GNIGVSLLERTTDLDPRTWIVLELSSFMLHWLAGWSPHAAVVTNLAPNHLDWHGTLDHYRASKQNILSAQQAGDLAILGAGVGDWPIQNDVRRITITDNQPYGPLRIP